MAKKIPIRSLVRSNDAFLTTSEKIYNYYVANTKKIWLIVGILVAAFLVAVSIKHYFEARQQKALDAYHQAAAQPDPEQATLDLVKVSEDFAGTPAGRQAAFTLATNYIAQSRVDEAIALLEELSKTIEPAEESLRPLMLSSLGSLYEEKGQAEKALAIYRQALSSVKLSLLTPAVQNYQAELLSAIGRVSLSQGQVDEAKQAYEELLLLAPDGYRAFAAKIKLSELASDSDSEATDLAPPAPGEQTEEIAASEAVSDSEVSANAEAVSEPEPTVAAEEPTDSEPPVDTEATQTSPPNETE
ncbi:MAG: tetratricopeptide repeat protein [Deltaproteobacteria bacterium]|jgi:tetratricopeptide (TPR) repeat protein|nr:tetratricopeptide repeat protein [Deltaproteobacteria bacterium]